MDVPSHGSGAWRGAQGTATCAHCGSRVSPAALRCPRCGNPVADDALTIAPGSDALTPTPTPVLDQPDEALTGFAGDEALTVAMPSATSSSTPGQGAAEPATQEFSDAMTIASPADADPEMTVAASPEALADAMTVATPVSSGPLTPAPPRKSRRSSGESGPLEVGQSFGPRYHIIRLLGAGGMGAVYQAWDAELGVAVAIKVIRPEVMADPVTAEEVSRRFKRELLLARQVTHKNVVRIHDLGDIDGIKYITMSYVEGTDLSTILKREGKQSVGDVMRIARSVVSGLVAAHTAGVVHRDLKPANIMIGAGGEALIMDFGIAHSTGDPAAPAPGAGLVPENLRRAAAQHAQTTVGSIVGTLEYMAPEQAKGQAIDQRADVYAFGLILYDILLGRRRASSGQSAVEELQRRMTSPPPPLQALDKTVPPALAAVVGRCVEPEADKRFQTSADVAAELAKLDDEGKVIPIARRLTWRMGTAAAVVVAALLAGTYYVTRQAVAPAQVHEPVAVVIADLENRTGDRAFDGVLEPMLRRALQEATFISGYDRSAIDQTLGVKNLPARFDEAAARNLANSQALGVVLAGFVEPRGNRYNVGLKAVRALAGEVVFEDEETASSKDAVLQTAMQLIAGLRTALGDETSESEQMIGLKPVSTTSLAVAQDYAAGVDAQMRGNWQQAETVLKRAVETDKNFGLGYVLLAIVARNLTRPDDAQKYMQQAMQARDGMTEREQTLTGAFYYRLTGDYQRCVEQYGELLKRYPADSTAHNQRALCLTKLREMKAAVDEMHQVVQLVPKRATYRGNLAVYAAYNGDFRTALEEAQKVTEPYDLARMAVAFAQLGQGLLPEAAKTYQDLAALGVRGASWSAAGLADLALYEGRFADALRILQDGAAADLAAKRPASAARRFASIAYVNLLRGQKSEAIAAARRALSHSNAIEVKFLVGRIFAEAGAISDAEALAAALGKELNTEPRAYGKIIEGDIRLNQGNAREAIERLTEANGILDTWIGHFDLGRAYLTAAAYGPADLEFDRCIQRRGQALALFIDEEPTYGYFPLVYYYRGLGRAADKNPAAAEAFKQYLAIRGASKEDPHVADARRNLRDAPTN